MSKAVSEQVLQEMMTYYKARAQEYDEWFYRKGRFDYGAEMSQRWFAEVDIVVEALASLDLTGDVLELAPGTGIWTERLVRTATTVTAVDASEEMVTLNRARVGSERVSYILADLFNWQPERVFDAVFFGFWLSHVPLERLDGFLAAVASMLRPGGKIFFVDSLLADSSTAIDHTLPVGGEQVMVRKLNDGRAFEIVKNFYNAANLTERCARVGLEVDVRETATYFLYGQGRRI